MLPSNFSWYLYVIILSDISTHSNLFTHCKGTKQDYKLGMRWTSFFFFDILNSSLSFTFQFCEFLKYTVSKEIKNYSVQPKFKVV